MNLAMTNTKVSGSVTSLPRLTGLRYMDVQGTQVGVPSEEQLETFDQQHRNCAILHDGNTASGNDPLGHW